MKPQPVNRTQFLEALGKGKKGYAQKPRSWQKVWYWWEDPKDPWFMNVYKAEKRGEFNPGRGNWVIAKDLDNWLGSDERAGYKFYIDE